MATASSTSHSTPLLGDPVVLYALSAGLVIIVCDLALDYAGAQPFDLVATGAAKGSVFVAFTAYLLQRALRRRDLERERRGADERLVAVTETIAEGIVTVAEDGRITYANPSAAQILGVTREKLVGMRHDDPAIALRGTDGTAVPSSEQPIAMVRRTGRAVSGAAFGVERKDGTWIVVSTNAARMPGTETGFVMSLADLTPQVASADHIEQLVYYDRITGLPNRALVEKYVEFSVAHARQSDRAVALLHLDIDGFKLVNDSLGKRGGDTLLKQVAARVQACVRADDLVGRPGGDELVVLLADRSHEDVEELAPRPDGDEPSSRGPAAIAKSILAAMKDPFEVDGEEVFVSTSIGGSVFPLDALSVDKLFAHAEEATYQAKHRGKGVYAPYAAELSVAQRSRFSLVTSLHHALERDELLLHYQPVVALDTGRLVGAEALIRWRSERKGLVAPGEFIPVAEETGLIIAIGELVLDRVVTQLAAWRARGIELPCAINISVRELRQENLVERVRTTLAAAGVPPSSLELEITESAIERDPERSLEVLSALRDVGVSMSIDDFGTGFSSLSRLKHLPAGRLKIDRSFVSGIPDAPDDVAIVKTVIGLAKNLGKECLAEGIETEAQWRCLRDEGCALGQGFLFGKPVPPDEIERLHETGHVWTLA